MLELARMALSRVRSAFRLNRVDEELRRELASHVELLTEDNIRRGMPADEARRTDMKKPTRAESPTGSVE